MKTIFKTTLAILFLSLFISCGDDSQDNNPPGEGNNFWVLLKIKY